MPFRLIHRTDHRGLFIVPTDNDAETEHRELIWTQAVWGRSYGCCLGFGHRPVGVDNDDFCFGDWYLHFVSITDDVFYKFVLSQNRQENNEWIYVGRCQQGRVIESLGHLLRQCLRRVPSNQFLHFHVGLEIGVLMASTETEEALEEYWEYCDRQAEECAHDAEVDRLIQDHIEGMYNEECAHDAEVDRLIQDHIEGMYNEECSREAEIYRLDRVREMHREAEFDPAV